MLDGKLCLPRKFPDDARGGVYVLWTRTVNDALKEQHATATCDWLVCFTALSICHQIHARHFMRDTVT